MEENRNDSKEIRRWVFRMLLFIYDAFALNFAYFMAIIIRFYIEYRWHDMGAEYIQMLWKFAPYYTVFSLLVFIAFRLYRGVWRYVGINDARRLLLANACTCVFQVVAGLLIVGRMPITYYCMGACIQLVLMSIPRIAPRFILESLGASGGVTMPMMIIGVGENARIIQRIVSKDKSSILKPVCVADFTGRYSGSTFNGLPVVSNMKDIEIAIAKYDVKYVMISDAQFSATVEKGIHDVCDKHDVEIRSFSMKAEHRDGGMRLSDLLGMIEGPVHIEDSLYENGNAALEKYRYNYVVDNISSSSGATCIKVHRIKTAIISQDEEWIKKYKEENGGEVSFFV